jgi:hypothetical protein
MNPIVEASWIAAGSGIVGVLVGVGGTVTVAVLGSRNTRKATAEAIAAGAAQIGTQIEADRRNRIWEKQATAYTDAITGIMHRQKVRSGQMDGVITGSEPARPPVPVDWRELEGRLIAYSSPAVIEGLRQAAAAGEAFDSAVGMWVAARAEARDTARWGVPPSHSPGDARKSAEETFAEANALDDKLMDTIRAELHAAASRSSEPPVPLSPAESGNPPGLSRS